MISKFSIGEVAKIHNITVETLRHYDRVGLLKPSYTNENTGYRYYSTKDFIILDLIKQCKSMGLSLEEIKSIIENYTSPESMLQVIGKQKKIINEKIEELKNSVKETSCDVIVGVGGGRIMDLVKATAFELGVPIVAIPTQAATCAAYSPLSVLYTPEGHSDKYIHFEYEVSYKLERDGETVDMNDYMAFNVLDEKGYKIEKVSILDKTSSIFKEFKK